MTVIRVLYLSALFLSATSSSVFCQQSTSATEQSCRKFVQRFYDWYVPIALKDNGVPASDLALKHRPAAFDTKLYRELQEESRTTAKLNDAGLDFDPFLNSQDPSPRFRVVKITVEDVSCLAEINGILSGKKEEDVTPELAFKDGRWVFVDFHYRNSDLLQLLLESLRERRFR
jgi:hypothetical protein